MLRWLWVLEAVDNLLRQPHVAITPAVRKPGDLALARLTLTEELAKLKTVRGLSEEIAEAEEDLMGVADEAMTWRLGQAARGAQQSHAERSRRRRRGRFCSGQEWRAILTRMNVQRWMRYGK